MITLVSSFDIISMEIKNFHTFDALKEKLSNDETH